MQITPTLIKICLYYIVACVIFTNAWSRNQNRKNYRNENEFVENDLSLWLRELQVKKFSGFAIKIFAIELGKVSVHLIDPNFSQYMPVIPSEVSFVNFTWYSKKKKYRYNFDRLQSLDRNILKNPTISIKRKGIVPRVPSDFTVFLTCNGNSSGIAMFTLGLKLAAGKNNTLPGTPLRLNIKKECAHRGVYDRNLTDLQGPDSECNKKCIKTNGWCNEYKICQCKDGYMGQYCETALCFPDCMNGGNCTAPAVCSCPTGYQGSHCEGGICTKKCLNGGKCIQKDICKCQKGYYGLRCEFSKCVIPCMNDGKCVGDNKCKCPTGLGGNHCEIGRRQRSTCKRPCKHGKCTPKSTCKCHKGWTGRFCRQREKAKN